jgi:hypothetical protein
VHLPLFFCASETGWLWGSSSPREDLPSSRFDRAEMLHAVLQAVLMT